MKIAHETITANFNNMPKTTKIAAVFSDKKKIVTDIFVVSQKSRDVFFNKIPQKSSKPKEDDDLKAMRVFKTIIKGDKVSVKDRAFLMRYSPSMYAMAIMFAKKKDKPKEAQKDDDDEIDNETDCDIDNTQSLDV